MKNFLRVDSIFWDFDGVILDSMEIRDMGFVYVLREEGYPENQISKLLSYHRNNGGLSRYNKFRYFYEEIRGEGVGENRISELAHKFSQIMLDKLCDSDLLIHDALDFIKSNHEKIAMHVVSGSDQRELRRICNELKISSYFKSIYGSPVPKVENVENMINDFGYNPSKVVLVGDSVNDMEAASANNINFIGYNNGKLRKYGAYIDAFSKLEG